MMSMLAALTFQNSTDFEPTNQQPLTVCQFMPLGAARAQATQRPDYEVSPQSMQQY